jgi:hypothetical protein
LPLLGCTHGVQMILLHGSHLLTDLIKGTSPVGVLVPPTCCCGCMLGATRCHHSQMSPHPAYCNHTSVDDCNVEKTVWENLRFYFYCLTGLNALASLSLRASSLGHLLSLVLPQTLAPPWHHFVGQRGEPAVRVATFCFQLGRGYFAQTSQQHTVPGLLVTVYGTGTAIAQLKMVNFPLQDLKTKQEKI